jgi:hypothetical protein
MRGTSLSPLSMALLLLIAITFASEAAGDPQPSRLRGKAVSMQDGALRFVPAGTPLPRGGTVVAAAAFVDPSATSSGFGEPEFQLAVLSRV